jgi:hypothetical protein
MTARITLVKNTRSIAITTEHLGIFIFKKRFALLSELHRKVCQQGKYKHFLCCRGAIEETKLRFDETVLQRPLSLFGQTRGRTLAQ